LVKIKTPKIVSKKSSPQKKSTPKRAASPKKQTPVRKQNAYKVETPKKLPSLSMTLRSSGNKSAFVPKLERSK
jgi:hypothetical protein